MLVDTNMCDLIGKRLTLLLAKGMRWEYVSPVLVCRILETFC